MSTNATIAGPSPGRTSSARSYVVAMASAGLILAAWSLSSGVSEASALFVPRPMEVIDAAVVMVRERGFLADLAVSSLRILVAFVASAAIAIPVGVLMSLSRWLDELLGPVIDFVRYVPVPALLPLFVLWTGIGEEPKFLVLFFGTFFQLVLLIKDDADSVPARLFELTRTLGASTLELVRDVLLPAMLPNLYDRLRVTLGWCWTYLVIAELIAVERGVGHVIKEAQRFNAADQLFVCLIALGFVGLFTDQIAKLGHRVLFPYTERASAGGRS